MSARTIRADAGFSAVLASLAVSLVPSTAEAPDIVAVRGDGWARRATDALADGARLVVAVDEDGEDAAIPAGLAAAGRLVVLSPLVCAVARHAVGFAGDTAPSLVELDLPTGDDAAAVDALTAAALLLPGRPIALHAAVSGGPVNVVAGAIGDVPLLMRTGVPVAAPRLVLLAAGLRVEVTAPPVDSAAPAVVRIDDATGERACAPVYESAVRHALRTDARGHPAGAVGTRARAIRAWRSLEKGNA